MPPTALAHPPEIHLRLDRPGDFFTGPEFDWQQPRRDSLSGAMQAIMQLEQTKMKTPCIVIEIHGESLSPAAQIQLRTAFTTYCMRQAELKIMFATDIRRQGWHSLRLGLLALAIALGFSAIISHAAPFPRLVNSLLSEGFIIVGWVVLWHPLEMLLYEGAPHRRMAKLFSRLSHCELRIKHPT